MTSCDQNNNQNCKEWSIDEFCFGKPLGKGTFGKVFLAKEIRTEDEHLVAIKILSKSMLKRTKSQDIFKRECEIQLRLKHPNIVRLFTWFHDDTRIYLVLEFVLNGTLLEKLNKLERFNDRLASTYTYQVTKALVYLHSLGIVHRDLKPENLLIGCFNEIKLADFGWAFVYDPNLTYTELAGTPDYLSPEIVEKIPYDFKVDNWSLGVLCYEMLTGKAPFLAPTEEDTYKLIVSVKYNFPDYVIRDARALITKLLVKNAAKRIELDDVFKCSWIMFNADKCDAYEKYSIECD